MKQVSSLKVKIFPKKREIFFLIGAVFASLFLYWQSLTYYFLQDDWFHFNISNAKNVSDFIGFFKFRQDIIGWRPIPKQLFFFSIKNIFGMDPFIAHLIIFLFLIGTIFSIFFLTKLLFKNSKLSLVTSFLYATAAFHFISLSWLSAGENVAGAFFFTAASYFVIAFFINRKLLNYCLAHIFFLLTLASTEFAITWPLFIIFALLILFKKSNLKAFFGKIIYLLPSATIIAIYITLRFIVFPLPAKADYQIMINAQVLNTLTWYILWLFNLPEILKYHLSFSSFSFSNDPTFRIPFQPFLIPTMVFFALSASSILILIINNLRKNLFFASMSFFIFVFSLFPVLFLPTHTFPYYLSIPSLGIFIFFAFLIAKSMEKSKIYLFIAVIFLFSWFFLSYNTLSFTKKTHWVSGEASLSRQIVESAKSKYPSLPTDTVIILYPTSKSEKQALMNQEAFKFIYNEQITTVFSQDALENLPNNVKLLQVKLK